jgi:hypothetical protein
MDLRSAEYNKEIEELRKFDYGIVSNELRLRMAQADLVSSEYKILNVIEVCISRTYAKDKRKHYASLTHKDIMSMTNIKSKGTVSKSLKSLVDKKILIAQSNGKNSFDYGFNPGSWDADLDEFYDMYSAVKQEMENNVKKGAVDWADFESKPKKAKADKSNIENWNFNDFGRYIRDQYTSILTERDVVVDSNTFRTSASRVRNMNLSAIVSELFEMSGDTYHQIVLKAYIDWFGQRRLYDVHNTKGFISIKLLQDDRFMKDFLIDNELFEKSMSEEELKDKLCMYDLESVNSEEEAIISISEKDLEDCSSLGLTRFMENYGIVVASNYLYFKKGFSLDKINSSIESLFNKLDKNNVFNKTSVENIVKNTFRYSPYNDNMIMLDWQSKFKKVRLFTKDVDRKMIIKPSSEDSIYRAILE